MSPSKRWLRLPRSRYALAENPRVIPLPYAFPAELIVPGVPTKSHVWAEVVPGFKETYRFGPADQDGYYAQYRDARFAFTWRKGGWECLRHYEILANGCIPVFRDLDACPERSLVSFPKALVSRAMEELIPWQESKHDRYDDLAARLLAHTRERLTCMALATSFLGHMGVAVDGARVLVLPCHDGANYTREMLLIGLKRLCRCIEHPRLPWLYDDFPTEKRARLAGFGFGYAGLLDPETEVWTRRDVRASIRERLWDVVVYGKMGVDERRPGTVPGCPFWRDVSESYGPDEIAFLYGGDGLQDTRDASSPYTQHLAAHVDLGRCFVRELA